MNSLSVAQVTSTLVDKQIIHFQAPDTHNQYMAQYLIYKLSPRYQNEDGSLSDNVFRGLLNHVQSQPAPWTGYYRVHSELPPRLLSLVLLETPQPQDGFTTALGYKKEVAPRDLFVVMISKRRRQTLFTSALTKQLKLNLLNVPSELERLVAFQVVEEDEWRALSLLASTTVSATPRVPAPSTSTSTTPYKLSKDPLLPVPPATVEPEESIPPLSLLQKHSVLLWLSAECFHTSNMGRAPKSLAWGQACPIAILYDRYRYWIGHANYHDKPEELFGNFTPKVQAALGGLLKARMANSDYTAYNLTGPTLMTGLILPPLDKAKAVLRQSMHHAASKQLNTPSRPPFQSLHLPRLPACTTLRDWWTEFLCSSWANQLMPHFGQAMHSKQLFEYFLDSCSADRKPFIRDQSRFTEVFNGECLAIPDTSELRYATGFICLPEYNQARELVGLSPTATVQPPRGERVVDRLRSSTSSFKEEVVDEPEDDEEEDDDDDEEEEEYSDDSQSEYLPTPSTDQSTPSPKRQRISSSSYPPPAPTLTPITPRRFLFTIPLDRLNPMPAFVTEASLDETIHLVKQDIKASLQTVWPRMPFATPDHTRPYISEQGIRCSLTHLQYDPVSRKKWLLWVPNGTPNVGRRVVIHPATLVDNSTGHRGSTAFWDGDKRRWCYVVWEQWVKDKGFVRVRQSCRPLRKNNMGGNFVRREFAYRRGLDNQIEPTPVMMFHYVQYYE
jgi:hypothetical protein